MAGAGLHGSDAWVGVPLEAMRGPAIDAAAEVRHAA
jgi:hypothetical protein